MRLRRGRLAWSLWGFSAALTVSFALLLVVDWESSGPAELAELPLFIPLYVLLIMLFPTVGALIASRHPRNPIGWMFCGTGVALGAAFNALLYADYALFVRSGELPGAEVAAWLSMWLPPVALFVTPVFLFLLFPTGRPPSVRWRIVVAIGVLVVGLGLVGLWFKPGPMEPFTSVENPFGVRGSIGKVVTFAESAFAWAALPAFLVGVAAILVRMRRSTGEERVQLKWFSYAVSVAGLSFFISFIFSETGAQGLADVGFVVGALGLVGMPVSAGIAILKYRLYDIDVIINRTLVYGVLTATLALVYVGLVAGIGTVAGESNLVVAGSTLAVAALFRPARARIQDFIDRRFNRQKYDAAMTIEAFSSRLRDEIDLDTLSAELLAVARSTMQPARASLWLRSTAAGR
jgi:hypothetical protein